MNTRNTEDIIGSLYDLIQDARSMPLASDKCIIERDLALDMLDEIIAQLPGELKQSRTIVESRNELIGQARRESETIIRQAQQQAQELVAKEAIYQEAKHQCEEMVAATQNKITELRTARSAYMDEALRRTEDAIARSLNEVRDTRVRFRAVPEAQSAKKVELAPEIDD